MPDTYYPTPSSSMGHGYAPSWRKIIQTRVHGFTNDQLDDWMEVICHALGEVSEDELSSAADQLAEQKRSSPKLWLGANDMISIIVELRPHAKCSFCNGTGAFVYFYDLDPFTLVKDPVQYQTDTGIRPNGRARYCTCPVGRALTRREHSGIFEQYQEQSDKILEALK